MPFRITPASVPEVLLIEPELFRDARGFFLESYHARDFAEAGLSAVFVQDNHSRSSRGVLRGLHYQLAQAQAKLVRVVRGAIFDVAVDIRRGSPTFGQWVGATLDADSHAQIFIPRGFAHGFCVLSETAEVLYKADAYYAPGDEHAIRWDDPSLAIGWPLKDPVLSAKDAAAPLLAGVAEEKLPRYGAE